MVVYKFKRYNLVDFLKLIDISPRVIFLLKIVPIRVAKGRKHNSIGKNLAEMLQSISPLAIKLGQSLATRSDIISEEVAKDLQILQDNVKPFDSKIAFDIIEKDLGKSIDELFNYIEPVPVASASVAQVYYGKDKENNDIAIKVLRPNIRKKFEKEFNVLEFLARVCETFVIKTRRLRLKQTIKELRKTVNSEIDLRLEAATCSKLYDDLKQDQEVKIPEIYWYKTSKNVLVMERLIGYRIDDFEAFEKNNISRELVLKNIAILFFKMVCRDGFFHADLHPGNILVQKDGSIGLVDFGISSKLSEDERRYFLELTVSFLQRDYEKAASIHFDAGWIDPIEDEHLFAQSLRALNEPILNLPQNCISIAKLLEQVFKVTEKFNMKTQPSLLQLQKTMLVAEGIGRILDPEVNMWLLCQPLLEDLLKEHYSVKTHLIETRKFLNTNLNKIPNTIIHFISLLNKIDSTGIKVNTNNHRSSNRTFWVSFILILWILTIITLKLF